MGIQHIKGGRNCLRKHDCGPCNHKGGVQRHKRFRWYVTQKQYKHRHTHRHIIHTHKHTGMPILDRSLIAEEAHEYYNEVRHLLGRPKKPFNNLNHEPPPDAYTSTNNNKKKNSAVNKRKKTAPSRKSTAAAAAAVGQFEDAEFSRVVAEDIAIGDLEEDEQSEVELLDPEREYEIDEVHENDEGEDEDEAVTDFCYEEDMSDDGDGDKDDEEKESMEGNCFNNT